MLLIETLLITIGLSMDSLAVSMAGGAVLHTCRLGHICRIAIVMALFQGGMTLIGYLFGTGFDKYIHAFDHWVAFGLLCYLGGRMLYEDLKEKEDAKSFNPLSNKTLIGMAFATSIDALAIGISFAVLHTPILLQAAIIAAGTFVFSAAGVYFGNHFGKRTKLKLNIFGGIILIAIGAKILIEHLFF